MPLKRMLEEGRSFGPKAVALLLDLCQAPSWNENMKCFLDLAINSENIGLPCSRY